MTGGQGESQNVSAPCPLMVSEYSGRWTSRASSEDIVGGAQTSDSSSNLLSATHETVTDLSLDLYLSWTLFLHMYMGTLLGP